MNPDDNNPAASSPLAPHWQGTAEELHWLEEAFQEETAVKGGQTAAADWTNPLDGLRDEPVADGRFVSAFADDTLLSLDDLTDLLLALEGSGGHDEIERLVAVFHRIKGSAAMVGLSRGAKLAHLMEDVLQDLLDTGKVLSSELTDVALTGTDALRAYVESLRKGIGRPDSLGDVARQLHQALTARPAAESEAGPSMEPPPVAVELPADGAAKVGGTLRVEIDRLDRLMGLAGQLTIQSARFHSIATQFEDDLSDRFLPLFEAVDQLDRMCGELRRGVMEIRMVPIGPLLTRYHRVVRDITRSSGKLARLEIHGG